MDEKKESAYFNRDRVRTIASNIYTPTKLSILFLAFFWLLLRYLYVKSGSNNDINDLLHFTAVLFFSASLVYFFSIMFKLGLFLTNKEKNKYMFISWSIFLLIVIISIISFKGYTVAGSSISALAENDMFSALKSFSILLNEHKFLPAMPIVTGIFSTSIEWELMPKIQAIDIIILTSGCVGLTIFGFYSYYWNILPKHLSISNIIFGAIGAIVLISYIANFAVITEETNGKLIVRLTVTIIFTIVALAVYMEYWVKSKNVIINQQDINKDQEGDKKLNSTNLDSGVKSKGFLIDISEDNKDNSELPPSPIEVGMWVFFGLVVLGDVFSNF